MADDLIRARQRATLPDDGPALEQLDRTLRRSGQPTVRDHFHARFAHWIFFFID